MNEELYVILWTFFQVVKYIHNKTIDIHISMTIY